MIRLAGPVHIKYMEGPFPVVDNGLALALLSISGRKFRPSSETTDGSIPGSNRLGKSNWLYCII